MSAVARRAGVTFGFLSIAVLALTSGCKAMPTTHYYVLEPRAGASDDVGAGLTVGVLPFEVDPPYDQDRIVYRIGADSPRVGFYEYHRWAAPLSRMLPRIASAAFRDVEGVRRIEPVASGHRYDVRLYGRVITLEEVDTAGGQHVRMDLVLTLIGSDGSTLWSAAASGRSDTSADTVEELVTQARSVAERVFAGQREGFARALASAGQSSSTSSSSSLKRKLRRVAETSTSVSMRLPPRK